MRLKITKKKSNNTIIYGTIIIVGFFMILLAIFSLNKPQNIGLDQEKNTDQSTLRKVLETGLVILVLILVVIGLVLGYTRAREYDKKRYLRVVGEKEDEYKLEYGDRTYYLRKRDLK